MLRSRQMLDHQPPGTGLSSTTSNGKPQQTPAKQPVRRATKVERREESPTSEPQEFGLSSGRRHTSKKVELGNGKGESARPRRCVPRRGKDGSEQRPESLRRRERSDAIGEQVERRFTERIDLLSRRPLYNPRRCFEEARRLAHDAEVAAMVVATAQVALEQQKRRETNVRRLKLRDSAAGENLAMQGQMAQLLAMRRQNQERDTKRKCAETILRWAKCELNDTRLLNEGAVDAAARLALEDDDMTRKFSATALRTLAGRELFWNALLQPHVLSAIRELFNEEPCYQPFVESDTTSRSMSSRRLKTANANSEQNGQQLLTNAVARDAALVLIQLTTRVGRTTTTDSVVWEERLAEKGIQFLLVHGAERHVGVAEGAASAIYNLTCVEKPHPHLEKIIQALVQMPGISITKVRRSIALALRNIAAHPSLILCMIEEGVVQRITQLAMATLSNQEERDFVDDAENSSQQKMLSVPEHVREDDDDALREACMWMMLRFAQNYVVRLDMIHAGANRAIFALLQRSRSFRSSVAIVAGWGAVTLALLAEAPGGLDIMSSDKTADTSRSMAIAIECATALRTDLAGPPVLVSVRAATHAAVSAAMITKSETGRAMLMASYFKTQKNLESVSFVDDGVGTCGAEDVLYFSLGSQASLVECRSAERQTEVLPVEHPTDSALHYFLITLAQLLGDSRRGSKVLAMAVKTGTLKNLTQMCCHRELTFPTTLWTSSADIFTSTAVDPILLLKERSCGSLGDFVQNMAAQSEMASSTGSRSNGEEDASFRSARVAHDTSPCEDPSVSMIPFSRRIIGPCALVFDRVSTFDSICSNRTISCSLVPGIVSLSRRIHELIAAGWNEEETMVKDSAAINSPSWCLVSCAAALGQLASSLTSSAHTNEDHRVDPRECPRDTSEQNALKTTVQTLEMLHRYATNRKADSHFYVKGATRTLIALRRIALESGFVGDVATTVVPVALKWYKNEDPSVYAAVASLCAALSNHGECRMTLLENGILSVLNECRRRYKTVPDDAALDDVVGMTPSLDTAGLFEVLGIDEIASAEDDGEDNIPNLQDVESDGRLCCAVILANMSLDSAVRLRMVSERAATALSTLSDTSYCEKMQLACARALCNLCTTAAEQACKLTDQDPTSPRSPSPSLAKELVMTLVDQKVVLPVAMIGAVRASRHSTRRFCAAALANLMAPYGQAGNEDIILKKADKQGLIPALTRLCRVDDITTRAYAACTIARISESAIGRDFLASRPLVLRALFSGISLDSDQLKALAGALSRSTSTLLTTGHSSTQTVGVNASIRGNEAKTDFTEESAIILRQRSIVRVACRLIGASKHFRAIAIQAGCLNQLVGMLTFPCLPELLVCMKAIKASAGDARYREQLITDSRFLSYLAMYADETNFDSHLGGVPTSDGYAREISIAAQEIVSLLIHDSTICESVARCDRLVYSLVAVALNHARKDFDPIHALTVGKSLLCVLLAANTQPKLMSVIKFGVLTALVSLGARHRAVYLASIDGDDTFDFQSLDVFASFELAAVVMSALLVVAKQGAASSDIALTIRNEKVLDMIAEVLSDEKTLHAVKKGAREAIVRSWVHSTYIRAHAVLYSFARYHESLRAKLNEVAVAAIHTVSCGAVLCDATSRISRAWIVSTLSLLLADTAQRNLLTENVVMISNVIEIARSEAASPATLLQDSRNMGQPSTRPLPGTTAKNLVWCFYQASRVPRKKTRIALQDAIYLNSQLAASPYIKECPWLATASDEAHRLLASEQYEHTIMTQDGTLEQLVKISFRCAAEENEGGASNLRKYEHFEFLADSLQPVDASVRCEAHDADLADDPTLLRSVPEETNDIFLCDGAGLGPTISDLPPMDSAEHSRLVPAHHDVQVDAHDFAEKRLLTPKASNRASVGDFGSENHRGQHLLSHSWLQKSPIPSYLIEDSSLEEGSLSSVVNQEDDDEDSADEESRRNETAANSSSEDSSHSPTVSSSGDDDDDNVDFKLSTNTTRRARNVVLRSEKLSVEDESEPPLHLKSSTQELFLAAELSKIFFLKHLTRKEIRYLVSSMERIEIDAGSELATRARLYIFEEGCCELTSQGKENEVVPNESRNHVGELSLLYDDDNNKTVATAKTGIVAWILDRRTFKFIMQANEKKKRILYSQFLSRVPLFQDIDPEKRNHVCDALQPVDFNAGDILIRQGERGDEFFILEEGSVECVQSDEDGVEKVIAPKVAAGAFFGELALLRDAPRAATVRALEDVSVVKIDRDTFHRAIGDLEAVHRDYDHSRSLVDLQEAERRRKKGKKSASGHEDESSDDDSWDYVGFQPVRYSGGRALKRDAVAAEPNRVREDWVPPTCEKTAEERDFLCKELSRLFFLRLLDRDDVLNLADAMHKIAFEPNDTLIRQGDGRADTCYIIQSGYCRVTKNGSMMYDLPDDLEAKISGGSARRHVGEFALLHDQPRDTTVYALSDVEAWCLNRSTFTAILQATAHKQRALYFQFLSRVPIFKKLDDAQKALICDALKQKRYDDGQVLIRQGDFGEDFFLVQSGTVVVTTTRMKKTRTLTEGQFFGERALLRNEPRTATVTALGPVSVLKIGRNTFDRVIETGVPSIHEVVYPDDELPTKAAGGEETARHKFRRSRPLRKPSLSSSTADGSYTKKLRPGCLLSAEKRSSDAHRALLEKIIDGKLRQRADQPILSPIAKRKTPGSFPQSHHTLVIPNVSRNNTSLSPQRGRQEGSSTAPLFSFATRAHN